MIDLHCHLDLYSNHQEVLSEIIKRRCYVLAVTTTPAAWLGNLNLIKDAPRVQLALGLHPELVPQRHHEIELFESFLPQTKYVGEIGIDGSTKLKKSLDLQKNIFNHILNMSSTLGGKIMSIHSRNASKLVLDSLEKNSGNNTPILHWFTGTPYELDRAIEMGCWFSINPSMTTTQKGQHILEKMPIDKILTETDGPFVSYNGEILYPWNAFKGIKTLSDIFKTNEDDIKKIILENFKNLCKIGIIT